MTDYHAPLPPSSAYLWGPGGCPGAMQMQSNQPPEEETEESREGDAAHWLLCQTLRKVTVPADAIAPNGVPINDEMREAIGEIVDDVGRTLAGLKDGDYFQNEVYGAAPTLVHPDNGGTADVEAIFWSSKTYHNWDFKYGHGFVDVYENAQLINYGAIAIESHKIPDPENWTFVFNIAQPRCYARDELGGTLRTWLVGGERLMELVHALSAAAYAASDPNAPCSTGDHCKHCRAAWDCEANQRAGGASIDLIHQQQSLGMDERAIGLEAKILAQAIERGKDRLAVLETKALEAISSGKNVPYHQIKFGEGRTVWDKARIPEAASLVGMFGVDVQPGVALPTPSQCIKQGVDAAVITPYTTRNAGAKKLVRVDDKTAAKTFGRR